MASAEETRKPGKAVQVGYMFIGVILIIGGIIVGVFSVAPIVGFLHVEEVGEGILFCVIIFLPAVPGIVFVDWADRKCGGDGLSFG